MKIDIIGRGNVGWHLAEAFAGCADANSVNPRTLAELRRDADLYLVCVSDDAIREVATRVAALTPAAAVLAHTSGTTPLEALRGLHNHVGVFYPLQTFTKGKTLNYKEIPMLLEADEAETLGRLREAAALISDDVRLADSEQRKDIHIASVLSCNFVNHLWQLSEEYLESRGIDFEILLPLIRETLRKMETLSPAQAQTGPARRNDTKTIESHLSRLETNPNLREIYQLLTKSIVADAENLVV